MQPAFKLIPATIVECPVCGVQSEPFTEPLSEAAVNRWKLQHGRIETCADCNGQFHFLPAAKICGACQVKRDTAHDCDACDGIATHQDECGWRCDDCRITGKCDSCPRPTRHGEPICAGCVAEYQHDTAMELSGLTQAEADAVRTRRVGYDFTNVPRGR